jgi:rubrerythrin
MVKPKPPNMNSHQECIDTCNSLLRGELSAIETYGQAIEKFDNSSERRALEILRADHVTNAQVLRQHIREMNAAPSTSSGPWGTFAKAVEGTATLLGKSPALAALEEGEKHGVDEYRDALENEAVMEDIKDQIRQTLLPSLEKHLDTLAGLRAA